MYMNTSEQRPRIPQDLRYLNRERTWPHIGTTKYSDGDRQNPVNGNHFGSSTGHMLLNRGGV